VSDGIVDDGESIRINNVNGRLCNGFCGILASNQCFDWETIGVRDCAVNHDLHGRHLKLSGEGQERTTSHDVDDVLDERHVGIVVVL